MLAVGIPPKLPAQLGVRMGYRYNVSFHAPNGNGRCFLLELGKFALCVGLEWGNKGIDLVWGDKVLYTTGGK